MAAPLQQDLVSGFDPTGQAQIQGSDLLNMVQAGTTAADKGLVINTNDVGGVPQVPNAQVTVKWVNYLWRRVTAGTTIVYFWNPNKAFDAILLYWDAILSVETGATSGTSAGGRILQVVETIDLTDVTFVNNDSLVATLFNTPTNAGGKAIPGLQTVFTPLSPLSTLFIECKLPFSIGLASLVGVTGAALVAAGLFTNLSANAVDAAWNAFGAKTAGITEAQDIILRSSLKPGSINQLTFSVRMGWIATWNNVGAVIYGAYNAYIAGGVASTGILGGLTAGRLKITEYL